MIYIEKMIPLQQRTPASSPLNKIPLRRWLAVTAVLAANSVLAQSGAHREQLIESVLRQLHHEAYDSAFSACAAIQRQWPDDPTAAILQMNIYQAQMRNYRVRIHEMEFDSLSQAAVALAEQKLKKNPTAEMFFMHGSARGLQALYRFQQGEWSAAFKDAAVALHSMNRALQKDPTFVDPGLTIGLYKYWKSQKLGFGIDLYAHERQEAFVIIEQVWKQGRYSSVEAAITLQNILLYSREYQKALAVNDWLHQRYPTHPSVLYHRALLLERLQRPGEALTQWETLISRIRAFPIQSHTLLAECYLHCAQLEPAPVSDQQTPQKAAAALQLAAWHAERRNKDFELESIFQKFEEIVREIKKLQQDRTRQQSSY